MPQRQASSQASPAPPAGPSPPPPQTQLFFPAFQFPEDWIPQLQVAGPGVQLHAWGSGSEAIREATCWARAPESHTAITLAAPRASMPAPLRSGPPPQNGRQPRAQLNAVLPTTGPRKCRGRGEEADSHSARDISPLSMDQEKEGLGKRQILPREVNCPQHSLSLLLDRPKVTAGGKPEHRLLPDPASGLEERERAK